MKKRPTLLWPLIIALSFAMQNAHAQKSGTWLTLYNHLPLFDAPVLLGLEQTADNRPVSFSSLALAIHWEQDNDLYYGFELSRVSRNSVDNGNGITTTQTMSLGYEIGASFPRRYNNIKLRMGGSLRYYTGFRTIDDQFAPVDQTTHGLIMASCMHVDWRLHKTWYFTMAPTLQLINGSFRLETNFDPQLTEEGASAVDFYAEPFQLLLRFGISKRL